MTYHLGDAKTASAPLRLQFTCQGDDFFSLGRAYGVTGAEIIQMQPELRGRMITKKGIQAFVKSRPGWNTSGLRPFSAKDNPGTVDAQGRPEGYAIFTSATQLMLPDMPRLNGRGPSPSPSIPPSPGLPLPSDDVSEAGVPPVVLLLGACTIAVLLLGAKKDKKKGGGGSTKAKLLPPKSAA